MGTNIVAPALSLLIPHQSPLAAALGLERQRSEQLSSVRRSAGEQHWEAARAARGLERQLAWRAAALVRREQQAVRAVARGGKRAAPGGWREEGDASLGFVGVEED